MRQALFQWKWGFRAWAWESTSFYDLSLCDLKCLTLCFHFFASRPAKNLLNPPKECFAFPDSDVDWCWLVCLACNSCQLLSRRVFVHNFRVLNLWLGADWSDLAAGTVCCKAGLARGLSCKYSDYSLLATLGNVQFTSHGHFPPGEAISTTFRRHATLVSFLGGICSFACLTA